MKQKAFLSGLLALALLGTPLYADAAQEAGGHQAASSVWPGVEYYEEIKLTKGVGWLLNAEVTRVEGLTDAISAERLSNGNYQFTAMIDSGDVMLHVYYKYGGGTPGIGDIHYLLHIVPLEEYMADFDEGQLKPPTRPSDEAEFPECVLAIVNAERAKRGARPLRLDPELTEVAMLRAKELRTYYSHTRPNGRPFASTLKHYHHRALSENIYEGITISTPEMAMRGWMSSTGHRENVLDRHHRKLGVGYYFDPTGEWVNYWVQIFED